MNNNYYQNPIIETDNLNRGNFMNEFNNKSLNNINKDIGLSEIFNMNRGRIATVYMTFNNSNEYVNKSFTGIIEQSGNDYVIISDPKTGKWTMLVLKYLDYVEFEETVNYK